MTILWDPDNGRSVWTVRLHYRAREIPPYDALLRHGHRLARLKHRHELPVLSSERWASVRRELRASGVAQRHLDWLGLDYRDMLDAADELLVDLALKRNDGPEHYYDVSDDVLVSQPQPFLFGLSQPLLDLAESYFGLPVWYLGVAVKRELANGVLVGTRNFHRDPEDERLLKIIVYLNDVDVDGGPFQCLNAADSAEVLSVNGGRFIGAQPPDMERIQAIIPRADWVTCEGPRLTANFCDTARCLHRASPPVARDRYSLTFSYLSRRPYLLWKDGRERQEAFRDRYHSLLNGHQFAALGDA
jgi:hypothetical protein